MIRKREGILRIAVQKSGRLSELCNDLLARCGVDFGTGSKRGLLCRAENLPVELMLVRDDDIPSYVRDGVCDIGIVGLNEYREKITDAGEDEKDLRLVRGMEFGHCRLAIAVPENMVYDGPVSLQGKRIATSYPNILRRFLEQAGVDARLVEITGSVEVTPAIGVADAICDLVSTGATLASNGLREVTTVLESEAIMVQNTAVSDPGKERMLNRLLERIDGVIKAGKSRYIMMNAPSGAVDAISRLIPGMEYPTIVPVGTDGKQVAIHAVAPEVVFWETMEQLKEAGASSILVVPIEKIID